MDLVLATATRTLMRIENVELTNIRTFAQAKYKIPTGLSLVTGQNGTGKSTLLGIAAAWAIWGQTPGRTQDFLVRHGEREMVGKVEFSSNGTKYLIARRFRLNKNGKGGVTQLLFNADNQFGDKGEKKWVDLTAATVKETQAKINYFAGSFEVWQMTAYVGQREGAGQFLEANAYDRKGILREIIAGAGEWDQWEIIAKKEVYWNESEILRIEGAIPVIAESATPLDAVTQTLIAARLLGVEADIALTKSTNNLENSNAAVKLGREVVAVWKDRDDKLAAAEIQAAIYMASIGKIDTNIADLQQSAKQLSRANAYYDANEIKISERNAEIASVHLANEKLKAENATNDALHETAMEAWKIETANTARTGRERGIAIVARIAVLKKVEAAHESTATNYCAECNQQLTKEHTGELKKLIAANSGWKAELHKLTTEYADIQVAKPSDPPVAVTLHILIDTPTAFTQDEKIIELRAKAENANELIATQQIQKDVLVGEAHENRSYITSMKQWIETTKRPELDYLEKLLTANQQALENDRVSLDTRNTHRQNIALGEQAVAVAQKAKTQLSDYKNTLSEHKVELHEWETVVLMCGTNGIRQLIIDQALAQLEPACNRWLGIIAPGFEIAFSTQTDTDRETFDEGIIMPNGAIQPWSELSGAQSVAVALAVRLGLAEVGGAAQGIHYETLYLDEADAWLTGIYQQQFMDMLAKVADTGIDVVAITHIETVKQMVDQQVEVVSNGNESRIK